MKAVFKCKGEDIFYLKHLDKDIFRTMSNNLIPGSWRDGDFIKVMGYRKMTILWEGYSHAYLSTDKKGIPIGYVNDVRVIGPGATATGEWKPGYGVDYEAHATTIINLDPTKVNAVKINIVRTLEAAPGSILYYDIKYS